MTNFATNFVHLGLDATATAKPPFDGLESYAAYSTRHAADGIEGRLVSMRIFSKSWPSWKHAPGRRRRSLTSRR